MTGSPESRAEGSSISPQHAIKNKGKQPMVSEPHVMQDRLAPHSPPVSVPGKRLVSERASLPGVCFREPMAETGSGLRPTQKVPSTYQLIRPKDEPFTDDMFMGDLPQYEAPIAVLHPGVSLFSWVVSFSFLVFIELILFFCYDFCPMFPFSI